MRTNKTKGKIAVLACALTLVVGLSPMCGTSNQTYQGHNSQDCWAQFNHDYPNPTPDQQKQAADACTDNATIGNN